MTKPSFRSLIVLVLAALVLVGGAFYFFTSSGASTAAADSKKEAIPNNKPALTVTEDKPQSASLAIKLSANGNITAWQEAIIGSESNGLRLTQVLANVGDVVKAGQVLATFSTDSTQADVAQARANLLDAQASALDAAGNAERARTLQSSGALSTQQINQYLTLEKTAKAKAEAAQAVLGAQQLKGRQTRVLAPDSGVISSRTATVGAVVGTGTELFKLIRKGRLEWRAEVTSAELGRIKEGMPVTLRPASGGELTGKVRMIAPSVDPLTRSALVYVDLPSPMSKDSPAKAGMFARGDFEIGNSNALTVPQRALVVRDGFNYLFTLSPDNRVRQVKVQTGRLTGDRVEILAGLTPDARIVVDGASFLAEGDLVRIGEEKKPNQPLAQVNPAPPAIK
jgi:HlyD family secretion protein